MSPVEAPESPKKIDGFEQYEIDSAARTLLEAEEIKMNPKLMKHVLKQLAKKKKAISSLDELRAKANNFSEDESMPEEKDDEKEKD